MFVIHRRGVLAGALAATAMGFPARAATPSDSDAANILYRRVEVEKRAVGIAAAIVTPLGRQIVCFGHERLGGDHQVSGETLFEIGSITKIFTALLLADMALDSELAIDDPVAKHLPADFVLPERDGRKITLADLATHTAGLPRFPPMSGSPLALSASYSVEELKAWLAGFELTRAPGSAWDYSNCGYALLGLTLSHRAGRSYGELLNQRILDPLGLDSTFLKPPARDAGRLAQGHDAELNPGPPLDLGIFAPAGSLLSSAEDLARFSQAVMPDSGSRIERAAQFLLRTRRPAPPTGGQQALGWEVLPAREGDYISKDGLTANQCATLVLDPAARTGVVVLSNTFPDMRSATSPSGGGVGAADIARHLLRPSIPLGA